jgi:hypothetical protein
LLLANLSRNKFAERISQFLVHDLPPVLPLLAARCSLFLLKERFPRVYHCNGYSEYQKPKPTFWDFIFGVDELPRVTPQVPVVLRRRQERDEDEFLQQ